MNYFYFVSSNSYIEFFTFNMIYYNTMQYNQINTHNNVKKLENEYFNYDKE